MSISSINYFLRNRLYRYVYAFFKQIYINRLLSKKFDPMNQEIHFGKYFDERVIEYPWILKNISKSSSKILDAGSVFNFKYLLDYLDLEKTDLFISTLAPEKKSYTEKSISYIYEDMREICYRDNYFDCIFCISTLEHVGMDNTLLYTDDSSKKEAIKDSYIEVITELRRVLKPKGKLFLTMPYGNNKNYGWLQTFDESMVDNIISEFSPSSLKKDYFKYTHNLGGWQKYQSLDSSNIDYFDFNDFNRDFSSDRAIAAEGLIVLELTK